MSEPLLVLAGHLWRRTPARLRATVLRLTKNTYCVGVVGLVPDAADRVLLLQHRFRTPFAWGLPGGFIESGETPHEAFARELLEETGLTVQVRPGFFMVELNHRSRYVSYVVLAEPVHQTPELNRREVLDWRFCKHPSLPQGVEPLHSQLMQRYRTDRGSATDNSLVIR